MINLIDKCSYIMCEEHSEQVSLISLEKQQLFCEFCDVDQQTISLQDVENLLTQLPKLTEDKVTVNRRQQFEDFIKKIKENIDTLIYEFQRIINDQASIEYFLNKEEYNTKDLINLVGILYERTQQPKQRNLQLVELDQKIEQIKEIFISTNKQVHLNRKVNPLIQHNYQPFQSDLAGHTNEVRSISFSYDSKYLISGSWENDCNLIVWRVNKDGYWIKHQLLEDHYQIVRFVKFSRFSHMFVSGGDNEIIVWQEIEEGVWQADMIWEFEGKKWDPPMCCEIKMNDNLIAIAWFSGAITFYEKQEDQKWKLVQTVLEHQKTVQTISINFDSSLIATGGQDNVIVIWVFREGRWCVQQRLGHHEREVYSLDFSQNSNVLVSGSFDTTIRIYKEKEQQHTFQQVQVLNGVQEIFSVRFNINTTLLVSGGRDSKIRLWKENEQGIWEQHQEIEEEDWILRTQFSNDYRYLAVTRCKQLQFQTTKYPNSLRLYKIC